MAPQEPAQIFAIAILHQFQHFVCGGYGAAVGQRDVVRLLDICPCGDARYKRTFQGTAELQVVTGPSSLEKWRCIASFCGRMWYIRMASDSEIVSRTPLLFMLRQTCLKHSLHVARRDINSWPALHMLATITWCILPFGEGHGELQP
jgi:hypothetical protein